MAAAAGRMKFALVSHVLPPSASGQAMVLYRLLQTVDPNGYCLISRQNYDSSDYQRDLSSRLSARYHHLPPEFRIPGCRFGFFGVNSWLRTLQRAGQIARIVKHERAWAIVACTGDPYDLPAGYLASRWIKVRYYPYIFDDYLYQWVAPQLRSFARRFETTLLKWADGIIVPNEFLRDDYRRRHGVEPVLIHNPCGDSGPGPESKVSWPADQSEIKVVYTGAVYHAHYDAFRNLLRAIQQIGRPEVKLHLYTEQLPGDLQQKSIRGPVVFHHPVTLSQVVEVQEKADILFLPLAFDSPIPEVIKTSAPGKMGEYLASGRPILVHAPDDSFLSWYFKKHGCGLVVDRNEPLELSRAMQRIIDDPALRRELREKALGCAKTDFSLTAARTKFMKLFEPKAEG